MFIKRILIITFFILITFPTFEIHPQELSDYLHLDKNKLPKGCGSCHKGHGIFNTPMLPEQKEKFCFRCHGYDDIRNLMKQMGYLSDDVDLTNIEKEFGKPYHHPIENTGIHQYGEALPELNPSTPRHSECIDCHNYHYVKKDDITFGIKGFNSQGFIVQNINSEYELCFKCHSNSANLPVDQTNKATMFNLLNPSYHPVVGSGKNSDVPSLIFPLTSLSMIKCSDCHGNNNLDGPKGPHGSDYEHILKMNFNHDDGPESEFAYQLCYQCHNRNSILSNESFFYHNLHISIVGASCRTCHNPHGSIQYTHLIDLESPSIGHSDSGNLDFIDLGNKTGQCFLNCHSRNHDPATYP
ncbi:MAG: cytochrome C [Nitrospirae bacterium]|nr:cytochrome C [Nitrospirota bacterium]